MSPSASLEAPDSTTIQRRPSRGICTFVHQRPAFSSSNNLPTRYLHPSRDGTPIPSGANLSTKLLILRNLQTRRRVLRASQRRSSTSCHPHSGSPKPTIRPPTASPIAKLTSPPLKSNILPLLITLIFVAGVGFVLYQIYLSLVKIQTQAKEQMGSKNVVFTKDGMRVGVKHLENEAYVDRTQSWVVKAWNLADEGKQAGKSKK